MFTYTDFEPKIPLPYYHQTPHSSLFLGRCCCPRRLAAPVAARDGKAVQYVSGEHIDHVAGEDEPSSAANKGQLLLNFEKQGRGRGIGTTLTLGLSTGRARRGSRCVRCCRSRKSTRCTLSTFHQCLPSIPHLPNHTTSIHSTSIPLHKNEPQEEKQRKEEKRAYSQ